jgi:hypothetical protein
VRGGISVSEQNHSQFNFNNVTGQINIGQGNSRNNNTYVVGRIGQPRSVKQLAEELVNELNNSNDLSETDKEQIIGLIKTVASQMEMGKADQGIVSELNNKLGSITHLFGAGSFINSLISAFMDLVK